ncbi:MULTISPECIES: DUF397 domain-containing protein [unclassified Streptomyces]|uniref:DUF397 domain-containing protein n=1 Tax=unclassified Streptomyces TaxID=2593676 RepID=UPI00166149DE|nr:hypothetical protein [Streptomyces sp. CBMA291]MBD0715275.1 hypothetical protein [Streptomyces sp. CBMA370]MBD0717883.1 hypothetical protein [Streptomyces sp. CBMA370]
MTELSPRWFTSSHSGQGGQCVEVAANLAATRGIIARSSGGASMASAHREPDGRT